MPRAREVVDAENARLLEYLTEPRTIKQIAKYMDIHESSSLRRIKMLDALGIPIVKLMGRPVRYIALT